MPRELPKRSRKGLVRSFGRPSTHGSTRQAGAGNHEDHLCDCGGRGAPAGCAAPHGGAETAAGGACAHLRGRQADESLRLGRAKELLGWVVQGLHVESLTGAFRSCASTHAAASIPLLQSLAYARSHPMPHTHLLYILKLVFTSPQPRYARGELQQIPHQRNAGLRNFQHRRPRRPCRGHSPQLHRPAVGARRLGALRRLCHVSEMMRLSGGGRCLLAFLPDTRPHHPHAIPTSNESTLHLKN